MKIRLYLLFSGLSLGLWAQPYNVRMSNPVVTDVFHGNYSPAQYAASTVIKDHQAVLCQINERVSPDSLKSYLEVMAGFRTRHTYSDTVSNQTGIGAAQRWAYQKFEDFDAANEDRLLVSYMYFDWLNGACGDAYNLKNVMAVLPGQGVINNSVVIIQAHYDSRCEERCDTACEAHGMEDNGSGSALVLELARVMSAYTFDETLVFMLTTGEEQGLMGATVMAEFCDQRNIAVKAVLNNDIVGGIFCGETASPPGCPAEGEIDSLNVRVFSSASTTGPFRTFARTIKMYYDEKMRSEVAVPMNVNIMSSEDRAGRGGDHIPFRQRGYRNVRFTAAHEHGHGAPDSNYTDRQHTENDILGVDTDNDNVVDSFYVNFNYLARNTVINGTTAALLALGPQAPTFTLHDEPTGLRVEITSPQIFPEYRVGVALLNSLDFEAVYRFSGNSFLIPGQTANTNYYVSVAAIDGNGIMSPFSAEQRSFSDANTPPGTPDTLNLKIQCSGIGLNEYLKPRHKRGIYLLPPRPNPFDREVVIPVTVSRLFDEASLVISDASGKVLKEIPLESTQGVQELNYIHEKGSGVFYVSLKADGVITETRKMVAE